MVRVGPSRSGSMRSPDRRAGSQASGLVPGGKSHPAVGASPVGAEGASPEPSTSAGPV